MYPIINLWGLELSTYGIMTSIGFILMGFVAYKLSRKMNIMYEDIVIGEIVALVGALIGSHLLYGIVEIPYIIEQVQRMYEKPEFYHYIILFFKSLLNGMVFYGGLIGGIIFGLIYCKIRGINKEHYSDCFAVAIPLFHLFGRIGCFLSGCCYGIESSFGFTTHNALVASCNNVNRFPVQLLEAGLNLILFGIMMILFYKGIFRNNLLYIYLILYGIIRFCDEFLRGDTFRGIWFGLSTSQWISIFTFTFSVILLIINYRKKNKRRYYI